MKTICIAAAGWLLSLPSLAQLQPALAPKTETLQKKVQLGFSINSFWGTIVTPDKTIPYFTKPCLGAGLTANYYFLKNVGINVGLQLQQRGAGIITPDFQDGLGNPDSTYRARLRFTTIDLPIQLIGRSKPLFPGVRLSGAAGIVSSWTINANSVFLSVEDGFHIKKEVSSQYFKRDLGWQLSAGTDISTGGSNVLQLHFFLSQGTAQVLRTSTSPSTNRLSGIRLTFLF